MKLVNMPDVNGALVLSTCNRVEVLIDVDQNLCAAPLRIFISDVLDGGHTDLVPITQRRNADAVTHIFRIAAGLDSMVVGEREISGQLRRALRVAHRDHTASANITRVCQDALSTSRKIAQLTGLASQGRSVVNVGLDLVEKGRHLSESTRALIIGTGNYAGATVAALRARGVYQISVYSQSGRAAAFARGHDLHPVDDLGVAMHDADVVISTSGRGQPIVTADNVSQARQHRNDDMIIVDLALQRDVADGVYQMPGVVVINLDDIQQAVPAAHHRQLERANQIVDEGVEQAIDVIRSRRMDPVVVALRQSINTVLTDELKRLPAGQTIDRGEAEHALRRLAARLAHTPSIRAREAAQSGHAREFVDAVHQVMGVDIDDDDVQQVLLTPAPSARERRTILRQVPRPDQVETGQCPVTGLRLADLGNTNAHHTPAGDSPSDNKSDDNHDKQEAV